MDIPISCRMVAFGLVFLLPISPSFSQQNKPLAGIIEDLKSSNGQTRFAAYSKVKSNKEILRAPEVKNALIDLLDRENQVYRNPAENYGEGFVEYVTDLLDTVEVFADWNDAHQACVMAHSAYGTHSAFATELATKGGRTVLPCLLEMAHGNQGARYDSVPVLLNLASVTTGLSSSERQNIRDAVLAGLHDSNSGIRLEIVNAAAQYGTEDLIPTLKNIASSDPNSIPAKETNDGREYFPVREAAKIAIRLIQDRVTKSTTLK